MRRLIKSIVESLGMEYFFEDWTRANVTMNGARHGRLPAVLDVLPVAGGIRSTMGGITVSTNRMVWFLDRIEIDDKSERDWNVVTRMLDKAKRFLVLLNDNRRCLPVTDVTWRAEYSLLDEKVGGVCLEFTLTPSVPECVDGLIDGGNGA